MHEIEYRTDLYSKSPFFSWIERNWLKLSSFFVFLSIIAIFNDIEFLKHILAEIAGIFLGIFLALVIVDDYNKRSWKKTRILLYETLIFNLCTIIEKLYLNLYFNLEESHVEIIPIIENKYKPNLETYKTMQNIIELINNSPINDWNANDNKLENTSDCLIVFFSEIQYNVLEIKFFIFNTLIQKSDDDELIKALIDFDRSMANFQNAIIEYKANSKFSVIHDLIEFMEYLIKVYEIIINRYPSQVCPIQLSAESVWFLP
jgi:hypothetical protein